MNELDLSSIYASYERSDGRGLAAYHPVLMARLLLYGYCIEVTSSRKIEQPTYDNVAFHYLSADQHPDHDTVAASSTATIPLDQVGTFEGTPSRGNYGAAVTDFAPDASVGLAWFLTTPLQSGPAPSTKTLLPSARKPSCL